ncbi:kelch domain-containing protein [Colletotrichum scovillei]|uniref:Kelch domain-containing protein n=1 Tax=Colletotrichum scovillei TaxID=1209932 RepID=A0A9P7RKN7_9PEZI|nr:kelch domain-containing protein [Colletotrichum scovillei]KAF4777573.1 kelch domain-containing protein [Colletotrichum scovillei]KAG7059173.1 kelch domain-containing protein [Colletotrichum scovillei]KAG7077813.1 kelch domain-containing protein [Colletotrichum scovillei]KAG7084936.1 kelch domain-containing protein [Colletotrichum scovillei]
MSFVNLSRPPLDHRAHSDTNVRPRFNSHNTSDRLREGSGLRPKAYPMVSNIKKGRKSVFKEVGLDDDFSDDCGSPVVETFQQSCGRQESMSSEKVFGDVPGLEEAKRDGTSNDEEDDAEDDGDGDSRRSATEQREAANDSRQQSSSQAVKVSWYNKLSQGYRRPRIKTVSSAPPPTISSLQRIGMIALLIAVIIPAFSYNNGRQKIESGAIAGVVRPRATTSTDVCLRWAQQAALLNGTLYMYGGQSKTESSQTVNTWNNDFLTLDLTKSWDTKSPSLKGMAIPSGPPAVANGYLWHDYDYLYLYGGQFADNDGAEGTYATVAPMSIWRYSVKDSSWLEFKDPRTSAGNYSTAANTPVQRSAEGAGLSVPELGLSWYFGGHLDWLTTEGWSTQTPRVYLKSLLEFTHPGYLNTGVDALRAAGAADGGVFRNVTEGGLQETDAFPERADGVLVFVPGWGARGVLIGMAGGSDKTFVDDLGTLDVYDIATSEWYHQRTTGDRPSVRVNPCAAIASAPDASSFQIYFFGGQNLQPFGNQTQYNDMYILSIPAFAWIKVDATDGVPAPRAGHTCTMRDGQIIVAGGYLGPDAGCESPGVFVFDASNLKWNTGFKAGAHAADFSSENSVLAGSYGYKVPDKVQSVIGGSSEGGATATTPAAGPATGGPFKTGTPPVFTVTQGGATATVTGVGPTSTSAGQAPTTKDHGGGTNPGLIAAGVIAGILGALALYLGFCAWLYRRQVAAYKQHLSQVNRYSGASSMHFGAAGFFGAGNRDEERRERGHRRDASMVSDESFSWVGTGLEPKWMTDDPTPGSGSGGTASGSGAGSGFKRKSEDARTFKSGPSGNDPRTSSSRRDNTDNESVSSTEQLLDGQEPSFFSVVMGPRRALRVVNSTD